MAKWVMRAAHAALAAKGFHFKKFEHLGEQVHYVEGGNPNAPLCLLLPGMGDSFANWTHFLLRYSKRLRLAAIDFPGYTGLSKASKNGDSMTFEEQLRVADKFMNIVTNHSGKVDYIMGNSMGGWQAVKLANRYRDRVHHLILVNPAGLFKSEQDAVSARDLYDIQNFDDFKRLMNLFWHKVPAYFYPYSLMGFYQFMKSGVLSRIVYSVEEHHLLNEDLAKITQDVSLIWGESDKLFPVELVQEFQRDVKKLVYYPVADAGHMPQLEKPTQFFKIINTILKITLSQRAA